MMTSLGCRYCLGVRFVERCSVTQVTTNAGRVTGVDTNLGHVDCNVFVNCTGLVSAALCRSYHQLLTWHMHQLSVSGHFFTYDPFQARHHTEQPNLASDASATWLCAQWHYVFGLSVHLLVRSFVCSSGQNLLPRNLINGSSNLDETYREYFLFPTDDLIIFWRSKVKVTAGHWGKSCEHHISVMNYLRSLMGTYGEWALAHTDDLVRFWRSKVKGQGGKGIHVNTWSLKSAF